MPEVSYLLYLHWIIIHHMKSLRTKFILILLFCILTSALAVGTVSILNIRREENFASVNLLNAGSRELAASLNHRIDTVTMCVDSVAAIAEEDVGNLERLKNPGECSEYLRVMQNMLDEIADHTENSVAYYIYLDPGVTGDEKAAGALYTRAKDTEPFEEHELTDITKFEDNDMEHVGWYYLPKLAGEPVWTEPYNNANLGLHEISYEVPLYLEGTFFGIVGMDLDFDDFAEPVREVSVYESGYAYLMDDEGRVYSHPELPEGTVPENAEDVLQLFSGDSNGGDLVSYISSAGIQRKAAFMRLHNGMLSVVSADSRAIYRRRNMLFAETLVIIALITAIWMAITVYFVRRITRPLVQLTTAADRIAQGHFDVDLPEPTSDEVGTLTRSFRVTTQYLKGYITDINSLAYRDPLTGVKNKTAYDKAAAALDVEMHEGFREFALVVLDSNNLKKINDRYGHASGDSYLQNACRLICRVFAHSPVYRIGGDEFAVLLRKDDYGNRLALIAELEKRMSESRNAADPMERISMAAGLAEASDRDETLMDVFERADEAMYRRKNEMKGSCVPADGSI